MSAIRGYFKSYDNKQYYVKVYQSHESEPFTEVELAGDSPFVVSYDVSNTPFEPIRTSTATISVVHNEYLDELYTPYAKGTSVKVCERDDNNVEKCVWCGYLVPKTYNQGYTDCYETIELEAADCVSVLQYLEYELLNSGGCVTFKEIINLILDNTHIKTYYWPHSKQANGKFITPSDLGIFEKNFFENDTEEPWKLQDVLREMCQYLGLTLIQWEDALYFIDYTAISKGDDRYYKYTKTTQGGDEYISNVVNMSEKLSRGNDADISFEPIYNKVSIKDNFYNVDELIPNIFDDKYLTNRNGDFYTAKKITVPSPAKAKYVSKIRKLRDDAWESEKTADDEYTYFMRIYDHKYFKSYYEERPNMESQITKPEDMVGKMGATIVDLGVVDESEFYGEEYNPTGSETGSIPLGAIDYANSIDFTRYLCICENHPENSYVKGKSNFKRVLMQTPLMKFPCQITKDSFLIFDYKTTHTRYPNRPYINPDWTKEGASGPDKYVEGAGYWGISEWPQGIEFRFIVGDKVWSSHEKNWVALGSKYDYAIPPHLKNSPAKDFWNTELSLANSVTYDMNINESGYPIPLSGISQDSEFYIQILCPKPGFWAYKKLDIGLETEFESHNAWSWISDFSIKLCEKGQDIEKLDNDVVYENVIDSDSINDFGEITFKMTTWHPNIKPSYSNVVTWVNGERVMLEKIKEANLSNQEQVAEENTIERYVLQYQTPTKKISHSLPLSGITPFDRMQGLDVSNPDDYYMQLGTEIDYVRAIQKITYIQCK